MSKENDFEFEIAITLSLVLLVFSCIVCLCVGRYVGEQAVKKRAIQNNAAEYVVDKDGYMTFKWKIQENK